MYLYVFVQDSMLSRAAQCGDDETSNITRLKDLNITRNLKMNDMILALDKRVKQNMMLWFIILCGLGTTYIKCCLHPEGCTLINYTSSDTCVCWHASANIPYYKIHDIMPLFFWKDLVMLLW